MIIGAGGFSLLDSLFLASTDSPIVVGTDHGEWNSQAELPVKIGKSYEVAAEVLDDGSIRCETLTLIHRDSSGWTFRLIHENQSGLATNEFKVGRRFSDGVTFHRPKFTLRIYAKSPLQQFWDE